MAAKKSAIESWLASKTRDYNKGVELYAAHPTAMRGLVNTLQRKRNKFTEEKLAYVLEKAAQADKDGRTAQLKKKGNKSAGKKSTVSSQQSAVKAKKKAAPKPAAKPHEEEE